MTSSIIYLTTISHQQTIIPFNVLVGRFADIIGTIKQARSYSYRATKKARIKTRPSLNHTNIIYEG